MASLDEDEMLEEDNDADGDVEYAEEEASEGESEVAALESSNSKRTGLANAMAKILSQEVGERKVPILAKVKLKQPEDSTPPKRKKVLDEVVKEEVASSKKRGQKKGLGHVRPDVTMLDRERTLLRIATRGAVQLFNVVKVQQKSIESQLKDAGSSEKKRSKVLSSVDKGSFVDMLKGKKGTAVQLSSSKGPGPATSDGKASKQKDGPTVLEERDTSSKWNVLRSDFMLGASMKDWDRQLEGEEEEEEQKEEQLS